MRSDWRAFPVRHDDLFYSLLVLIRHLFAASDMWFFLTAVFCLQWQIIGRIDDVMKLAKRSLLFNPREPSTLNVKMTWSKNIREERESPTQILFGAMDPIVCPLLNLAAWLEGGEDYGSLLFGSHRTNRAVSSLLETIFNSELFRKINEGLLGTHSIRKGAASYAAHLSLIRDWIATRGHWRMKKMQVDTYIEINLPYPDARVASILTGPRGPCKYTIKGGYHISDAIIESLVPKIFASFGGKIARVLALPLLWAAFEGETSVNGYTVPLIPPHLASNIKDCWVVAGNSPDVNPIEKVSLSIQQVGDQLVIVPICSHASPPVATRVDGETGGDVDVEGGVAPATNAGSNGSWAGKYSIEFKTLFLQQFILHQRMEDLRQEIISLFGVQRSYLRNMNTSVKRIAAQPVVRSYSKQGRMSGHLSRGGLNQEDGMMDVEMRNGVKLSKNPRDLYVVWKE